MVNSVVSSESSIGVDGEEDVEEGGDEELREERESRQVRDLNIDDNNLFSSRSDTILLSLPLLPLPLLLSLLVVSERPVIGTGDEAKTPQYVRSDVQALIPSLLLLFVVDVVEAMSSSKCVV